MIEIFQDDRGSGEQPEAPGVTPVPHAQPGRWAVEELRAGRRFGFIASGDHTGLALAGVWPRELTRAGLCAAFRERRCYASTGTHVAVAFECNGRPMGAEHAGSPARFELRIGSEASVDRVEVLRNGRVERTLPALPAETSRGREDSLHHWEDLNAAPGDFWYCRIHWADGELAWTSPIWI